MPRPPAITRVAEVSSGRSDLAMSSWIHLLRSEAPEPETLSTEAEPPSAAALSKAVTRTVPTLTLSLDLTVAMALPAYMGRLKVSSPCTSRMSEMMETSSLAQRRGAMFLPSLVAEKKMCEKDLSFWMLSRSGVRFSATPWSKAASAAASTVVTPLTEAACLATASASAPATSTVMSPPSLPAAEITLRVGSASLPSACSASTRVLAARDDAKPRRAMPRAA
mmetsp:Transcript_15204/g.38340  ORF Transcript_15204/g.38340 Transcript_15204/m.38340 type:complete len:222 (+) Transcript_15204:382-1047(+)